MKKILPCLLSLFALTANSQDIRSAYIRTKIVSGFTQSITVTLFTDGALTINRPGIPVFFGDGNSGTLTLNSTSGSGTVKKVYSGIHTYTGNGSYLISFQDTFRVAGIKNISNSQTQPIYTEALIVFGNISPQNTSPLILNEPLNFGVSSSQFFYNPAYTDTDGDSLSYTLVSCYGAGYYQPGNVTINSSGLFSFYSDTVGLYAFSIVAKEWRKNTSGIYKVIGSTQMDFVLDLAGANGIKATKDKDLNLSLYPNPVSDEFTLICDEKDYGNFSIEIINAAGQIVLTQANNKNIDVANLPKGLYLLKVSGTYNPHGIARFIKQ
ncbi:MAG: T9SS type A sorting domain-containing protein [Bacteroidota bacterium]